MAEPVQESHSLGAERQIGLAIRLVAKRKDPKWVL
jgi:hypothetical protein